MPLTNCLEKRNWLNQPKVCFISNTAHLITQYSCWSCMGSRCFQTFLMEKDVGTAEKHAVLPIFDYDSIIHDICSDGNKYLLDKTQLSAAEIILGCLKTTFSTDALLGLNLLLHRREISMLHYFSKIIFRLVPCPFHVSLLRSFSEFVPYILCHNQDVRFHFSKNLWHLTFFSVKKGL